MEDLNDKSIEQAGAELCQAQDKLGWLARVLSLTFKLFLPLELFTNIIKYIEIVFFYLKKKIELFFHLKKMRSSSIWEKKLGCLPFEEKNEIALHLKKLRLSSI